jgi:hypothetical protein
MGIPEDDRMHFSHLDRFLLELIRKFVEKNLPRRYNECIVKPVVIENGMGMLPHGIDCIQMIVGSCDVDYCEKEGWREEIVGMLHKSVSRGAGCNKGCNPGCDHQKEGEVVYGVYTSCECGTPDCNHPVVLAAEKANKIMGVGGSYMLTKHTYGVQKNMHGQLMSPHFDQYFAMAPTQAQFFGEPKHLENGIGHLCKGLIGEEWEYKISSGKISTNFKSGKVLVSYTGRVYDEKGLIMLPQIESFIGAIEDYVLSKAYFHLYKVTKAAVYKDISREHKVDYVEGMRMAEQDIYEIDPLELESVLDKWRNKWHFSSKDTFTKDGMAWATILEIEANDY